MQWLLFALVGVLALGVLLRPWWGGAARARLRRRGANVRAYESRLEELQGDAEAGVLESGAIESTRRELAQRVLSDTEGLAEPAAPTAATGPRWPALLIAIAIVGFGATWYWARGSWQTQALIERAQSDPEFAQAQAVEAMVAGLAARLEQDPSNGEGWRMLGRSYFVMERYADAARAYGTASTLAGGKDPDLLVNEAEALAMSRDRDLQGRPAQLFERALQLAPDHGRALWYAGLAAAQSEDYDGALRHWQRLLSQDLPAELRSSLQQRVAELGKLGGAPTEPVSGATPAAPAADEGLRLTVRVRIRPDLAAKISAQDTLFVFAKADGGPPMPLAVQRLSATSLPTEVVLDDTMAMMAGTRLSAFDRWIVTARISRAGGVQAQPGDLQGELRVSRSQAADPVQLEIDRVVP